MELRFFAFALTLLLLIPGTVLSEETTRQSKVRAVQRAAQQQQQQRQNSDPFGLFGTPAPTPRS